MGVSPSLCNRNVGSLEEAIRDGGPAESRGAAPAHRLRRAWVGRYQQPCLSPHDGRTGSRSNRVGRGRNSSYLPPPRTEPLDQILDATAMARQGRLQIIQLPGQHGRHKLS